MVLMFLGGAALADPEGFVADLGAELEAASAAGKAATAATLDAHFDLDAMALAALPQAYRTKADRAYVTAYRDFLAAAFVRQTLKSGAGEMRVLGSRVRDAVTMVGTMVEGDGQRAVVEFYLRAEGDGYRVVNATVEGVLITARHQSDFHPVLISGDMPALMAYLKRAAAR